MVFSPLVICVNMQCFLSLYAFMYGFLLNLSAVLMDFCLKHSQPWGWLRKTFFEKPEPEQK